MKSWGYFVVPFCFLGGFLGSHNLKSLFLDFTGKRKKQKAAVVSHRYWFGGSFLKWGCDYFFLCWELTIEECVFLFGGLGVISWWKGFFFFLFWKNGVKILFQSLGAGLRWSSFSVFRANEPEDSAYYDRCWDNVWSGWWWIRERLFRSIIVFGSKG